MLLAVTASARAEDRGLPAPFQHFDETALVGILDRARHSDTRWTIREAAVIGPQDARRLIALLEVDPFAPVFSRIVRYSAMETDEESFAVVQVVPGRSEYRDLRVVETTGEGRTIRERWTWDEAARAYRLSRRQGTP